MSPLENYLRELRDIRSAGAAVKETSYYPALSILFNEIGKTVKPKVRCVLTLANRGAGLPDGGLFTPDQFRKPSDGEPLPGQNPARGVIEIKSSGDDAWVTAESEQVTRYWRKYRQVLVTNYRDFVLVGQDADGKPVKLESFRLAENEKAFWAAASTPRYLAKNIGDRFIEYIQRVMRHAVPIAAPEDVAWFLASYARDARARIEGVDLPALATVRAALEEALGLKFQGEKGEHFFRSSLVQTLFYGVFSAWVLWAKQHPGVAAGLSRQPENGGKNSGVKPPLRFDWMNTARYLRVPMIRKLFYLVADPHELEALNLTEVLDWTATVLNRVDRRSFFERFQESHAVQYFYEPFLEAFDPDLRKQMGVWYTPPEIVKYMVERVDSVLREELGVPLGLADKNVYVLDPCCGTGSYLVEVLDRIHRTIKERGEDGLTASDLKDAAQHRIFGFEILPAPFVVSHLQLGLLLQNLGAPLDVAPGFSPARAALKGGATPAPERVAVYLSNALTGWEPPKGPKKKLLFPELEEERDAAEHVKRDAPILVILGNPPYNAFAGVSPEEEQGLVEPYKTGLISKWGIKKFNLDDLYVRFFRLAERRIAEGKPGKGVVCYISNFSYLSDPSFVVMRERFLKEFDKLWFDCMNGDSRETGKLTPEGKPDPSVFSTEYKREGIQVGTAIALLVRVGAGLALPKEGAASSAPTSALHFRHLWGKSKRQQLLESAPQTGEILYEQLEPTLDLGLPFAPSAVGHNYGAWPLLPDLFPISFPGVKSSRDAVVVDIDRERLVERMQKYFDAKISHEELLRIAPAAMTNASRFEAGTTRDYLRKRGFLPKNIVRYCYRPFDLRWVYWEPETKLLDEKRTEYFPHVFSGNIWLAAVQQNRKSFDPPLVSASLCSLHVIERGANLFPLQLHPHGNLSLVDATQNMGLMTNLSPRAVDYTERFVSVALDLFHHSVSILYAPAYRLENASTLRQDWPRIPLPDSKDLLLASAALGRQIASLLDTETPFDVAAGLSRHLKNGDVKSPLQDIAAPTRVGGGQLDDTKDFAVAAGWGHGGKGGITMPGKGRIVERDFTGSGRTVPAMPAGGDARATLGDRTCDVYLNDVAYWKNVPIRVWEYTIGGYQVMKKWLSYREEKLLGRALTKEEVRYVQQMARRIAAILLLEPELHANYQNVKTHAYVRPG